MALRTLRLAGAAVIAAALLVPAAVSAQNGYTAPPLYVGLSYGDGPRDRDGYPRPGSRRDGYARDATYYEDKPTPRRPADRERRERCSRDSAGSLLGAIAGGLLGDSAGGSRGGPSRAHNADRDCD